MLNYKSFMISQNNPPKEMPQSTLNKLKSLLVLHCLFHTKIILLNDTLSELSKNLTRMKVI